MLSTAVILLMNPSIQTHRYCAADILGLTRNTAAAPAEENRTCEPVDLSYTRPASIPHVINHAVSSGLIHDDNPVALFMDLTRLRAKAEVFDNACCSYDLD